MREDAEDGVLRIGIIIITAVVVVVEIMIGIIMTPDRYLPLKDGEEDGGVATDEDGVEGDMIHPHHRHFPMVNGDATVKIIVVLIIWNKAV